MTSTRETCSDGARMGASAISCMCVLGDWHRCAGFETSKLVRCAGQLVQFLESGLRRLLSSRRVRPAAAGLCPPGGPRPAPSAHEYPSSRFRAKLSSRKGHRQLLSRGSMASAVHTRQFAFVCGHAIVGGQDTRFIVCTGIPLLPWRPQKTAASATFTASASTSANSGVLRASPRTHTEMQDDGARLLLRRALRGARSGTRMDIAGKHGAQQQADIHVVRMTRVHCFCVREREP